MSDRPHRRFTVEIRISGDTLEDVEDALNEIARERVHDHVLGGSTMGYFVKVTEDPTMTHAKYHAAIESWLVSESKGKDPRDHEGDHECG